MESYFSILFALFFFPFTILLYQIFPNSKRGYVLLSASLIFFWSISGTLILFMFISTLLIYCFGLWTETYLKAASNKKSFQSKKKVLCIVIILLIGILVLCKYTGFFLGNLNNFFTWIKIPFNIQGFNIGIPIGISFYTLQAISYCVDVYHQKIRADRYFPRLLLYLVFFPTIMEGPICRYEQTAYDLWKGQSITYESLTFGLQRILWGIFKKLIIADRLNPMVDELFSYYTKYGGEMVLIAMISYTIQLYMDFSGTMDVVIGMAEIFGIRLPENFRQPFFSKSISEFWQRWHITLGTWFKDYLFYPISMSKFSKKLTRKTRKKLGYYYGPLLVGSIALFAVWLANGLWHGAGWNYIFFGIYHFILILGGNLIHPWIQKKHLQFDNGVFRYFAIIRTTILVCIGELFFRANGLQNAFAMFQKMFTDFKPYRVVNIALKDLHIDIQGLIIIGICLVVVFIFSVLKEKKIHIRMTLAKSPIVLRWSLFYILIFSIIIFGAYGTGYVPVDPMYASY